MSKSFSARSFLKTVTELPGVYQMLGDKGVVLYVGKAKNLKKRLKSYFQKNVSTKTQALVENIVDIKIIVTATENEALILECTLIKEHQPPYNILMRDDKTYPYLMISNHDYPRFDVTRGNRHRQAEYYGPYPNVGAVRETLKLLQKLFKLRQCSDVFYQQRKRPCLQYQIKRCKAPCVGYITEEAYAHDVEQARQFLRGKRHEVVADVIAQMETASVEQRYEEAARLRDLIGDLKRVQAKQHVANARNISADIFAIISEGATCVAIMSVRQGQVVASQCYFPAVPKDTSLVEALTAFVEQYYFSSPPSLGFPDEVIVNVALASAPWWLAVLSDKKQKKVQLKSNVVTDRKHWLEMAEQNARVTLQQKQQKQLQSGVLWEGLSKDLTLPFAPNRIECFDISHSQGEATVASCVVFNVNGPVKQHYRKFNIKEAAAGDDYAAMSEALRRRYERLQKEEAILPEMVMVDGGKGQVSVAKKVMAELGLEDIVLVGIAKGPSRKPGLEQLIFSDRDQALILLEDSASLHLLQTIRDEAHRFAITGHRARRKKARQTSTLEGIPGVGAKRRQLLLKHFGGLQGVKQASVESLMAVPGVSRALAEKIAAFLR